MTPQQLVRCVDFRYITDAITPDEAIEMLQRLAPAKPERIERMVREGFPAYTTSAGWLGYSDEKLRELCRKGLSQGWRHFKMKVGRDLDDDLRRAEIIRSEIGAEAVLMMDANQVWDVKDAIANMAELARFRPLWIEEPTSPDDIAGHAVIARAVAPIGVASGEHCHNRVMFKQLLTSGAISYCQLDSCRLGGVNEAMAVILLAAKFGVPVCPHAGGVGLSEYVQHLSMFDYVAVSGSLEGRLVEYVDHLHEHFLDPVGIRRAHYVAPNIPGYSIQMKPESMERFAYPSGPAWSALGPR
jgi:L-fuconate dehydratase